MSRARPLIIPEEVHHIVEDDGAFDDHGRLWLDVSRNGQPASSLQLELLAAVEDVDLDDLLDSLVTQGEALTRLREALGQGPIPVEVLERQVAARETRRAQPECKQCGRPDNSTKHHYVPKWMLKELDAYQSRWSDRTINCIPLCTDCHKAFHQRDDVDKSIVSLLSDSNKAFADSALSALAEEHPKLVILIAKGERDVYENQLVRDWFDGKFESH